MNTNVETGAPPVKRKRGRPKKSESTAPTNSEAERDLLYVLLDPGNFGMKVAYKCNDGRTTVVRDRDGQTTTLSVAGFVDGEPDKFIGGKGASNYRKAGDPQYVCTMLKRGRAETEAPALIDKNGRAWTFREMEVLLVQSRLNHCENLLGRSVDGILVAVPACYSDAERRASVELVEIAGWKCIGTVNEPTAAALGYGVGKSDEDITILVVDIGGGTSDTTVLRVQNGKTFTVLSSRGRTDVAGLECTTMLRQYVMDELARQGVPLDSETMQRDYIALEMACEEAKIDLSSQETVRFTVLVGTHRQDFSITREQFAAIIAPVLEQIKQLIEDTLAEASLSPDQIDKVVRVGGASCMPCIYDALSERFGSGKIAGDIEPETAVVVGAGEAVGIKLQEKVASGDIVLPGKVPEYLLNGTSVTDIASEDIGVKAKSRRTGKDVFVTIIPRGTPLPAFATQLFGLESGSEDAEIVVLEGNAADGPDRANVLATFSLSDLPLGPDVNRIEITKNVTTDGVINVCARDTYSGQEIAATLDTAAAVSKAV